MILTMEPLELGAASIGSGTQKLPYRQCRDSHGAINSGFSHRHDVSAADGGFLYRRGMRFLQRQVNIGTGSVA
jgi:hypothetical protein